MGKGLKGFEKVFSLSLALERFEYSGDVMGYLVLLALEAELLRSLGKTS